MDQVVFGDVGNVPDVFLETTGTSDDPCEGKGELFVVAADTVALDSYHGVGEHCFEDSHQRTVLNLKGEFTLFRYGLDIAEYEKEGRY